LTGQDSNRVHDPSSSPRSEDQRPPPSLTPGDERAFVAFYNDWFPTVHSWARDITGRDEAFCLDVVQETMLRVIRSMPRLETHAAFVAWLRAATRSAAIDLIRRQLSDAARARGAAKPECVDATTPLRDDDAIASLLAALERLDPEDQLLLRVRANASASFEDLATAFGGTPDSLYGRARRALAKLRGMLDREVRDA
jgi:RNA polymerase sigma factor (sigma-70 family)